MNSDLSDLLRSAQSSLRNRGVERADELARGIVGDLQRSMPGQSLYIARDFDSRNSAIRSEYNGANAGALAVRYGVSKTRIFQILSGY